MQKKELIRLTAIDLFEAYGFYNTSTPMIAKAAQISIGTIYNYFRDKGEILDYIFFREYAKREVLFQRLEKSELPIVEKIQQFIEFHYTEMRDNPKTARVIIQESMQPSNKKLEYVHKMVSSLPVLFTDMLKKAQQKGEVSDIDPEFVGTAIFLAARGVAYTIQTQADDPDYYKAMEEINSFIIHALQG